MCHSHRPSMACIRIPHLVLLEDYGIGTGLNGHKSNAKSVVENPKSIDPPKVDEAPLSDDEHKPLPAKIGTRHERLKRSRFV